MTTKKKRAPNEGNPDWKKGGKSPNPAGRTPGRGRPVSRLRTTLARLREMEDQALVNIKNSIDGTEVDSKSLDTSKWVISNIVTVNRAAVADEQLSFNIRAHNDEREEREQEKMEGTTGNVVRFSPRMIDDEDDD